MTRSDVFCYTKNCIGDPYPRPVVEIKCWANYCSIFTNKVTNRRKNTCDTNID